MERDNYFTGKPEPEWSKQEHMLDEKCEHCGTNLISNCLVCGAPVCCPKCCYENEQENDSRYIKAVIEREEK